MQQFFQRPDDLVFGNETAMQAVERFGEGIAAALSAWPDQTVVIVTHGTVLSLFAARHNPIDPYTLWRQLGLPAFLVLDRPTLAMEQMVATVG